MTGRQFVARLRRLGRRQGVVVAFDPQRGKGSHGLIRYGDRVTTVPDLRRELRPGLVRALCRQLGVAPEDFERIR